jgi:hypothetical protein
MNFKKRDFKFREGSVFGNKVAETTNSTDSKLSHHEIMSGVALEVISNPYEFLNLKKNNVEIREILSRRYQGKERLSSEIRNYEMIDYIPMNSIVVKLIEENVDKDTNSPVLCFPFFSSHFSLPIKPGEYVWILKENIRGANFYYWMSRKPGFIQTEDANYTNVERNTAIVSMYNEHYKNLKSVSPSDDLVTKSVSFKNQNANVEVGIENVIKNSIAYNAEFTGEPSPRLSKNCSDLLIQGSNNAGIHLTTEKFSKNTDPSFFSNSSSLNNSNRTPGSGAIDIYVNRKHQNLVESLSDKNEKIEKSKISLLQNNFSNSGLNYTENNKIPDVLSQGNNIASLEIKDDINDAVDVAGRIYLTANSNFDLVFNSNFNVLSEKSGPAAVLFGKHARVVSETGTRITSNVGESFIDLDEEGNVVIKAAKGGAYISLRKDGSIAIVPGANGLLYLGGDEGDAINIPLGNRKQPGEVLIGTPIVSTMGGVIGDPSPSTGNFATKVLIK